MPASARKGKTDGSGRQRLLDAARELFERKGYAATSVRKILSAAGVTAPVLYYHFGNKEGLFLEMMREPLGRFMALLDGARAWSGTARERILRLSDEAYALFLQNVPVVRIMYGIYYGPPHGAPFVDFEAFHRPFRDVVRGFVRQGIVRREFRRVNVAEASWALIAALNVAMEAELCHPELHIDRKGLRRILGLAFDGVAVPGGSGKSLRPPAGRRR